LIVSNQTIEGNPYYLQYAYSSVAVTAHQTDVCWADVELLPHFTATNLVNNEDDVAFDALESGVTLNANPRELKLDEPYTVPQYKWEFGDGTSEGPSSQASVIHSYQYGGDYPVTLTVTDSGGYVESLTKTISVFGALRPTSGAVTSSTTSSGVAPEGPKAPGAPAVPAGTPTIAPSVLTRSLKKAVRLGLAVHYNVNEQVAGRAEALLDSSTAARLGIKGGAATGLPKGYPRSIVVGSAVLVTTQAGQGTLKIRFSKTAAAHLAKVRRVKLTLRFVLRSASRTGVRTATALTTVTLSR
jgi:hypothetical protein